MNIGLRLLAIVSIIASGTTMAGTQYAVTCTTPKCGFTTSIGLGGGRMFEQASGYCLKCAKVVSVTWKRDNARQGFLSTVFDHTTGRKHSLFKCPACSNAFIEVKVIEAFSHCPKCGKKSLQAKRTLLFD